MELSAGCSIWKQAEGVKSMAASVLPVLMWFFGWQKSAPFGWSWFISPPWPNSSWFSWQESGSQSSPLWTILLGNLVSWDCVCHRVVPGLGDSLNYEREQLTSHGQSCQQSQKANFSSKLLREGPDLLNSFSSLCFCCFQPDPLFHYLKIFKCFSSFKIEV